MNEPSRTVTDPPKSPTRFIFHHLVRFRWPFVAAILWSVVFVIVPMQVPLLAGMLVNGLIGNPASFYGLITLTGTNAIFQFSVIGLVVVAGAYGATAFLRASSVAELGRTFVREQRKDLIRKLDRSPIAFHQRLGSGELLSRMISDTESTRMFVTQVFFNTVQNAVRVAYPVVVLVLIDPWVALAAVAILPFEWIISRYLQARLRLASRTARATKGRLTGAVVENLEGIETIQTSNAEESAIGRVADEADRLAADEIRVRSYFGMINGTTWTLTSIGVAIAWGIGGWQVLQGALTVGALVAVTGYAALLYLPMQGFTSTANTYQNGVVAFERIREVLDAPNPLEGDPSAPPLRVSAGRIEFEDVSFAYGLEWRLIGVDVAIPARRLTVLVGANGSGKSTALKLISRLYDPTAGRVLIDGQDIRSVSLGSVRSQVAVVPQSPMVFSGTVADNIRFGQGGVSDRDVARAAEIAGAAPFIEQWPERYATRLGPGGPRLSGGEVQRIAIARALVRRPRILLLDEANSALDRESESRLIGHLATLRGETTVVMVAHHLEGVLEHADHVIRLDGGRIVPSRDPAGDGRTELFSRGVGARGVGTS